MNYRDPTCSQLNEELCQERTKNAILEEENKSLRELLKKEINSQDEPPKPNYKRVRAEGGLDWKDMDQRLDEFSQLILAVFLFLIDLIDHPTESNGPC